MGRSAAAPEVRSAAANCRRHGAAGRAAGTVAVAATLSEPATTKTSGWVTEP